MSLRLLINPLDLESLRDALLLEAEAGTLLSVTLTYSGVDRRQPGPPEQHNPLQAEPFAPGPIDAILDSIARRLHQRSSPWFSYIVTLQYAAGAVYTFTLGIRYAGVADLEPSEAYEVLQDLEERRQRDERFAVPLDLLLAKGLSKEPPPKPLRSYLGRNRRLINAIGDIPTLTALARYDRSEIGLRKGIGEYTLRELDEILRENDVWWGAA